MNAESHGLRPVIETWTRRRSPIALHRCRRNRGHAEIPDGRANRSQSSGDRPLINPEFRCLPSPTSPSTISLGLWSSLVLTQKMYTEICGGSYYIAAENSKPPVCPPAQPASRVLEIGACDAELAQDYQIILRRPANGGTFPRSHSRRYPRRIPRSRSPE